jgi:RES domain-containing protein
LQRVVDLTDRSVLGRLGVGDVELAEVGQEACRTVGGAAHWLESDGILVPSARGEGNNLVTFPDRSDPDAPLEVLDRETIDAE